MIAFNLTHLLGVSSVRFNYIQFVDGLDSDGKPMTFLLCLIEFDWVQLVLDLKAILKSVAQSFWFDYVQLSN